MCPGFDHREDCVKSTQESYFQMGEEDVFLDFADTIPLKGIHCGDDL